MASIGEIFQKVFNKNDDTFKVSQDEDFATQTTLSELESKDFATETTLALLESENNIEDDVVVNSKVTFPESAGAGDVQTLSIPAATGDIKRNQIYLINIYNGSNVTTISADLETEWEDSDTNIRTVSYELLENLLEETAESIREEAVFLYNGGTIEIINDTATGEGEGYDVYIKVVKI